MTVICDGYYSLRNAISCRPVNPDVAALVPKYPTIRAASLVGPHLKKPLTGQELKVLTRRLEGEAELQQEMSRPVYEGLLDHVYLYRTLTAFAENEEAFTHYARNQLRDQTIDFAPLSPKRRILTFHRTRNKENFYSQVADERMRRVAERCFPRFAQGYTPFTEGDRGDIEIVSGYAPPNHPADRLVYADWVNQWRTVDYLERENWQHPSEEITVRKNTLREGPLYPARRNPAFRIPVPPERDYLRPLREAILTDNLSSFNWTNYLNLTDQLAIAQSEDNGSDPEFLQTLRCFNELTPSLETVLKGRVLLQFLENRQNDLDTEKERRSYDLGEAIKPLAEVARVFRDWVQAMESLEVMMQEPERKADFSWFRQEISRLLPSFSAFAHSFPRELIEIDRLLPSEVERQFSPAHLEVLIRSTLNCLNSSFYRSFSVPVALLNIPQKEAFSDALSQLKQKHKNRPGFAAALTLALPNAYQVPPRVRLCLEKAEKSLSKASALQPLLFSAVEQATRTILEAEHLRESGYRRLSKQQIRAFYPTVKHIDLPF